MQFMEESFPPDSVKFRSKCRKEASPMSTWSGIRNKLENDYLCPALRGHIQYFATSYSKSHDHEGRAAIRLDGVEVLRSNYYDYCRNYRNRYQALRQEGAGEDDPKKPFQLAYEGALNDGCSINGFSTRRSASLTIRASRKALCAKIPWSASSPCWTAGWESAACWLWRNPWSKNLTGCGPSM